MFLQKLVTGFRHNNFTNAILIDELIVSNFVSFKFKSNFKDIETMRLNEIARGFKSKNEIVVGVVVVI